MSPPPSQTSEFPAISEHNQFCNYYYYHPKVYRCKPLDQCCKQESQRWITLHYEDHARQKCGYVPYPIPSTLRACLVKVK